jgi:polyphosphate glucokinase
VDWKFEAISVGYPGPVLHNRPVIEPHNLAKGWTAFDFHRAFGKPMKFMNDAAMQALGSYRGGKLLFLELGHGTRHLDDRGRDRRAASLGGAIHT